MALFHILSRHNPKIKELVKQKDHYYFFEGEKLVRDILKHHIQILFLLVDEKIQQEWPLPAGAAVSETWVVSSEILAKVSRLQDPPPVIAVTTSVSSPVDFSRARVVIGLDQIQDPGNAGTVFRCAAAFGVDGVVFTGASVNFTNSKFIRAAQNALIEIPHHHLPSVDSVIQEAQDAHMNIYLTTSHPNENSLPPQQVKQPCLILFGNEGQGLDEGLFKRYPTVFIPQTGKVESLNVGISACLIMYQVSQSVVKELY